MSDVAKLAGVSRTTVSFVLNDVDGGGISEGTKERVREVARELGYRLNAGAKALRDRRTHTIGFITDEIASTPFAGNIIKGAQEVAWEAGKILLIVNTDRNPKIHASAVEMMLERRVDGIIYAAMSHEAVRPPVDPEEVPLVLLNCYSEDRSCSSVVPDEVSGGRKATEALISKGHEKIAFINLFHGMPATAGRLKGYKLALSDHGLPFDESLVSYGASEADDGYRRAGELLQSPDPPTAVFCGTDRLAMGAYEAFKEEGLKIPEDIAVVGFDNQEIIAAYLKPSLSTVALPHREMGLWAVKHLIEQVERDDIEPVQHVVDCPYVERESL
jgi:LacI family transcriptional regulator